VLFSFGSVFRLLCPHPFRGNQIAAEHFERANHIPDFVLALDAFGFCVKVSRGKLGHDTRNAGDWADDPAKQNQEAGCRQQQGCADHAVDEDRKEADFVASDVLQHRLVGCCGLHELIDYRSMLCVGGGDLRHRGVDRNSIAALDGRDQLVFDGGPESLRFNVQVFRNQTEGLFIDTVVALPIGAVAPEGVTVFVVLFQLRQGIQMLLQFGGLPDGKICLQIGFDQVCRRRKHVGNQILRSDDLIVVWAVDRHP